MRPHGAHSVCHTAPCAEDCKRPSDTNNLRLLQLSLTVADCKQGSACHGGLEMIWEQRHPFH